MKITKFGQCCLLIEVAGKRILTDPGRFGAGFTNLTNIDLVLITHEHSDHLHTEALTELRNNNPTAKVVCNQSVSKILTATGVTHIVLEGRGVDTVAGVPLEAYDGEHEEIFAAVGQVQNTGYYIHNTLFYPGDAFTIPDKVPHALALPVAGPWCKLSDALHYVLAVKPGVAFPVHDWVLSKDGVSITNNLIENVLSNTDIVYIPLDNGETITV